MARSRPWKGLRVGGSIPSLATTFSCSTRFKQRSSSEARWHARGHGDHRGLKEPVGEFREELVFQSILAHQDTVRTHASIAMAGTAISDVAPVSVAGDNFTSNR